MANQNRPRKMFVAMPFREHYDGILDIVKEAASTLGLETVQVGELSYTGSIISKIRSEIEDADIMTAIVTEENGNVYYEIGLAHCQQKPVVLLTTEAGNTKFDLRDHRAIVYDPQSPDAIKDQLIKTVHSALEAYRDPNAFVNSVYGNSNEIGDSDTALHDAVEKIAESASLTHPVSLVRYELTKTNELAIEVCDFMDSRVRAIVDINGIIRKMVRPEG